MRIWVLLLPVALVGCEPPVNEAAVALATRLAEDGDNSRVSPELRVSLKKAHVACATEALSDLPVDRLEKAMQAPDSPAIWAILGDDALDALVATCRKVELKVLEQQGRSSARGGDRVAASGDAA